MLKITLPILKQNLEKKIISLATPVMSHMMDVLQLATACDLALWIKNELIQKSCVPHMQA